MLQIDRRRSSIEVIADMLRLGEAGKTEIMYSANMSYFQLKKYLNFLLQLGLIDKVKVGNPMVTYRITRKGLKLLKSIDSILEILEPEKAYLPKSNISSTYIFAGNEDFFAYPNNYHYYVNYYKDTFQHGGISLEEVLVPFISLLPKNI